MPIVPARKREPTKRELAVLLLPTWLQVRQNPTGSTQTLKEAILELEAMLAELE